MDGGIKVDAWIDVSIAFGTFGVVSGCIASVLFVKYSVQRARSNKAHDEENGSFGDIKLTVQVGKSHREFLTRSTGNLEQDVRRGIWREIRESQSVS